LCLHEKVSNEEARAAAADGFGDQGKVKDCLKEKLLNGDITNPVCIAQIARVLAESRADIQVDPLLHRACATDVKRYCFDVPPGEGRRK
jgi:Golgi apparatus protein 1